MRSVSLLQYVCRYMRVTGLRNSGERKVLPHLLRNGSIRSDRVRLSEQIVGNMAVHGRICRRIAPETSELAVDGPPPPPDGTSLCAIPRGDDVTGLQVNTSHKSSNTLETRSRLSIYKWTSTLSLHTTPDIIAGIVWATRARTARWAANCSFPKNWRRRTDTLWSKHCLFEYV